MATETRVNNYLANHVSWMTGLKICPKVLEIAVFELLGSAQHDLGAGVHPWGDPNIKDEFYEEYFTMDSAHYHIYAVEWTPTHIDFFIDNVKTRTINQSPPYPMQFLFSVFEHPFQGAWTGDYDPTAPYPKSFTIDYFRAYQPTR
jgi:beta-glucanase (GH16 family)